MALTLVISQQFATVYSRQATNFTVAVTNSGASAVSLLALSVSEATESDAQIQQPVFQTPNTPVGTGNPILAASSTAYFGFQAVFTNPQMTGPSPQHAPGGAAPANASYQSDPFFALTAQAQASDGSVASVTVLVDVLAPGNNDPIPQGGALWLSQGANFINFLTQFA